MYYVLNVDGNRYGPVTREALQQWYREGRIVDSARFLDAATEEPVERERLLPPVAPVPTYTAPPPPGSPYGQAYRDVPPNYTDAPQPHLVGAAGDYAQGNPSHNPVIACLLCFFCQVAGYIYNKQIAKGIVLLLCTLGLGYVQAGISWVFLIVCMVDCYKIAKRIRSGETVGAWQFF